MATLSQRKLMESIKLIEKDWLEVQKVLTKLRTGEREEIAYRYVSIIGKGSFGVVVKIMDDNNRIFALKRVYQDKKYHNRELNMLLEADHPNVVNLISYFYTDKSPSGAYLNIITEFADINLEEYLALNKDDSIEKIKSVYNQILRGLVYLHHKNICHRDIKPSNILMDSRGLVKICDLGSAKIIKDGGPNVTYICSRFYRAPENILGYEGYDFKIDIWSAACVMAEFRVQEPMFKGETSISTLNRIFEIVKVSENDLVELGCDRKIQKPAIGVKRYLEAYFENSDLLNVLDKSLTFSPHKRLNASKLLSMPFFIER